MAHDILKDLDAIDAAVFSGDSFLDPENLKAFKNYLGRWSRQIPVFEAVIAEETGIQSDIDSFIIDLQSAKDVKVGTETVNYFNAECDPDSDDGDELIFTFGIENGDLIFSESNIISITKICDRQWELLIEVDEGDTSAIFTFLI